MIVIVWSRHNAPLRIRGCCLFACTNTSLASTISSYAHARIPYILNVVQSQQVRKEIEPCFVRNSKKRRTVSYPEIQRDEHKPKIFHYAPGASFASSDISDIKYNCFQIKSAFPVFRPYAFPRRDLSFSSPDWVQDGSREPTPKMPKFLARTRPLCAVKGHHSLRQIKDLFKPCRRHLPTVCLCWLFYIFDRVHV